MNGTQLQAAWFGAPANKSASKFPVDVPDNLDLHYDAQEAIKEKWQKALIVPKRNLKYLGDEVDQGFVSIISTNRGKGKLTSFRVRATTPIFIDTKDRGLSKPIVHSSSLDVSENTIWEITLRQPKNVGGLRNVQAIQYIGQKGSDVESKGHVLDTLLHDYGIDQNAITLRKARKSDPSLPAIYDHALVYATYEADMPPGQMPAALQTQHPRMVPQSVGRLNIEKLEEAIDRIDDILTDYDEEIWVLENSALGQAHSALEDYKHTMEKALSKMR